LTEIKPPPAASGHSEGVDDRLDNRREAIAELLRHGSH